MLARMLDGGGAAAAGSARQASARFFSAPASLMAVMMAEKTNRRHSRASISAPQLDSRLRPCACARAGQLAVAPARPVRRAGEAG